MNGKKVWRAPVPVVGDYVAVLWELVEANTAVTLAADVFFVDGTAFLMTVSRRIKFVMAKHVPMRMAVSLSKHLHQVRLVYGHAGFRVRTINGQGIGKDQGANTNSRMQYKGSTRAHKQG